MTRKLTVEEVAKQLHLSERRVRDLLFSGMLIGHKTGRKWVVTQDEVDRYLGNVDVSSDVGKERKEMVPQDDQSSDQKDDVEGNWQYTVTSRSHTPGPAIIRDYYSGIWIADIELNNPSPKLPVGIRSFMLEVSRGDEVHLLRHLGESTLTSDALVPLAEDALPQSVRLDTVTTIRGKLRFLDRASFDLGTVNLSLVIEESDGRRHQCELGEMDIRGPSRPLQR